MKFGKNFNLANSIGNSHFGTEADVLFVDAFYLRLQGNVIYFTESATDSIVIGALRVATIKDSSVLGIPGCFEVSDNLNVWDIC